MTEGVVSHYRILDKLGEGGMGVVYKAEDTRLKRFVALKFLRPEAVRNPESKARFLYEARAAASLDHPNVCTVHEIDEDGDGQLFIVMPCLDGETLREKIGHRPLPLTQALELAIQIGEGLQAAHEKGIVHRDVKSANVMITSRGQPKVMDFGLAHLGGRTRLTKTGSTMGTPGYMSPEQAQGSDVDRRSDIWSLGVVLYEMLTGQLPFKGDSEAAVIHSVLHDEPEPLTALRTGVPIELDRVMSKALEKDPRDRYQHVEDLVVDLRRVATRTPTGGRAPGVAPRRRMAAWWPAAAAVVVLAAAAVSWQQGWLSWGPSGPPRELKQRQITSNPREDPALSAAISPDGLYVAYADLTGVHLRLIATGEVRNLKLPPDL